MAAAERILALTDAIFRHTMRWIRVKQIQTQLFYGGQHGY